MKKKKLKLLFIFLMKFPTNHAVLTNVYADYFGKKHDVTWIMPRENPGVAEKTMWKNIRIFTTKKIRENSFLNKLFNYISSFFQKKKILDRLLKKEKFDMIQTRNDPFDALLAIHYSKKYKIPFVYQYSFPIYEKLIYTAKHGGSEFPKLFSYLFGHFGQFLVHNIIMKKADLILPISEWMKKDLIKNGIPIKKLFPFPMGAKISQKKFDGKKVRKKNSIRSNEKVLIYLGNMEKTRNLKFLIEAFRRLKEREQIFKVLMVGDGPDRKNLVDLCKKYGLENVIFTGRVPYKEVNNYLAASDIGLSPFNPLPFLITTSPTKVMEYMAMELPVVCNNTPEQNMIIEKTGAGICTNYEKEDFAKGVEKLINYSIQKRKSMGKKGKNWIKYNRDYVVLGKGLEKKYTEIINSIS